MDRIAYPLFATNTAPENIAAKNLQFEVCDKSFAANLIEQWHSRLPKCQSGPWQFAFHAYANDVTYAVALWNNPSARTLPSHWLELRRLAAASDAPRNTCSKFIGWMVRHFKQNHPERERCISYQDPAVHSGTIYKASNWSIDYVAKDRVRDRSGKRKGTNRFYRSNLNGEGVDSVGKVRWGYDL
jgi:hypothetical protein